MAESAVPGRCGFGRFVSIGDCVYRRTESVGGNRYDERKFVTIAANIESTVIKVPAGFQDYYPPLYGSVSCIHFRPDGSNEALDINTDELERRIAICYTGEPRLSDK